MARKNKTMTSLAQLHLFLKFHFAPPSEEKIEVWKACCTQPYTEAAVREVCANITLGDLVLTDYEIKMLRIVAEPSPPDDKHWAERITCIPEPADVKWALVNLLNNLGYKETATALSTRV